MVSQRNIDGSRLPLLSGAIKSGDRSSYDSGSSYDTGGSSFNPNALGNSSFNIGSYNMPNSNALGNQSFQTGGNQGYGVASAPPPPQSLWGAPNPAYQTWLQGQQQNQPAQLQQQQFQQQGQMEGDRWNRVMAFLQQMGLAGGQAGGGLSQGLQNFSGQTASLKAQPAIRSYDNAKRTIANQTAGRGMSLSSAAERSQGQAYGELARALAEAGTYGDVSAMGLQYSLLGDILNSAMRG
jgi:hypothetical protein